MAKLTSDEPIENNTVVTTSPYESQETDFLFANQSVNQLRALEAKTKYIFIHNTFLSFFLPSFFPFFFLFSQGNLASRSLGSRIISGNLAF